MGLSNDHAILIFVHAEDFTNHHDMMKKRISKQLL